MTRETRVSSWGRLRHDPHQVIALRDRRTAGSLIAASSLPGLAVGMERSYGDVSTNRGGTLWDCRGLDKFLAFDEDTGILSCESGVLLRDIQATFSSRGWMLPVTPGTALVTVGGAIANDVHGKNHHVAGSFGNHVLSVTLLRTDGEIIECSPTENPDWFAATVGGLGLTGVILEATVQLARVPGLWLAVERLVFESLDEFFELSEASSATFPYTVAWIDITTDGGRRGILTRATPTDGAGPDGRGPDDRRRGGRGPDERSTRPLGVPLVPPFSLVNRATLPALNRAYFHLQKRSAGRSVEHYRTFFYPLDAIANWNRLYGPRGFYQHQSVIPPASAREATREILAEIGKTGTGSFLGVLKTMGTTPPVGMLSFAAPGVSVALDFPAASPETPALLERLDRIVATAEGRIYPAKDARMPRELFRAGYPRIDEFATYRDPGIASDLARRLLGS
ncbi:FAD-binding protein [Gryllotalpicola reticulitermitis]|uniref:FAD-binding protein n=1 Tax=Gryllotalpicola reticulitermitis TaxID=1184153 RepID=A0ABV8Q9Z4_9MICO